MTVPKGYILAEKGVDYGECEYWIDTSITLNTAPSFYSSSNDVWPQLQPIRNIDSSVYIALWKNLMGMQYDVVYHSTTGWQNVVDGVVIGYPTLYCKPTWNASFSNTFFYVKSPKKLVPLYEGDEIQDEIVGTDVTSNGTYEYTPETGFVATKKVSLKVAVPQLDTSDATATSSDMLSGKTAYVNGVKVTGNIQTYTPSQEVVENGTLAVKNKYVNNDIVINVQPTLKENYEFIANGEYPVPEGFDGYGTVKVNVPNVNPYTASSESEFNTYLTEENVGNIVKYAGETTETLKKDRLYLIKQVEGVVA